VISRLSASGPTIVGRRAAYGLAIATLICGGCSQVGPSKADAARARQGLDAARRDGSTVYYLGDTYHGLAVTGFVVSSGTTHVMYGTCRTSGDSGCGPPFQVETERWPPDANMVAGRMDDISGPPSGLPDGTIVIDCRRVFDIRGVIAITIGPDGPIGLLTGNLMVRAETDNVRSTVPLADLQTIDGKVPANADLPPTSAANRAWVTRLCTKPGE
jgi:hypothetical protein